MDEQSPPAKRGKYASDDVSSLNKDELIEKYQKQQKYIEELEAKLSQTSDDSDDKEKRGAIQSNRRENVLVMRLATKEQEVQECIAQINHIKKVQEDAALLSLRQANLDPGVNLLFGKMREELQQTKDKLEQAQSELSAWKFTPDSQNGKKLISRCRTLIAENQELGKQLSQGKTAQLEAELALQKKYSEELKGSQEELNEFVIQLDEEVEGMQSTIQVLQAQLAATKRECESNKEIIRRYEDEQIRERTQKKHRDNKYQATRASPSRNERSDSENEYEVLSDSRMSRRSSSYEEGEYSSDVEYANDNASVTGSTDQLDDYEILETLPSDHEESQENGDESSKQRTSRTSSARNSHYDNHVDDRTYQNSSEHIHKEASKKVIQKQVCQASAPS